MSRKKISPEERMKCRKCGTSLEGLPKGYIKRRICRECSRNDTQDHKEELKQYYNQYYQDHKEERKQTKSQYYQDHKEELKQYGNQYYQDHKEERKQYKSQYYQNHKEERLKKKTAK
jgi:gas vesicle protein